jgi:CDP-6-deoxy-D-xylo-4-hexulose-3-dehydrase
LATYNIDLAKIEDAITPRTRAIIPVHLLGNPVGMDKVMEISSRHDLIVIEDACEAHGASIGDSKAGSFGLASTFSFFFSHHINTVEGGMITTDDDELADLLRSTRAHGWARDYRSVPAEVAGRSEFQKKWLFLNTGFNLRPTELAGAFGIHQILRLEGAISIRRANAKFWTRALSEFEEFFHLPREEPGTRHVWFGYPMLIQPEAPFTREELTQHLEKAGIATRPIIAGNILEHPVAQMWPKRVYGESVRNAELVHRRGFMIGNHQGVDQKRREYVVDTLRSFITR